MIKTTLSSFEEFTPVDKDKIDPNLHRRQDVRTVAQRRSLATVPEKRFSPEGGFL